MTLNIEDEGSGLDFEMKMVSGLLKLKVVFLLTHNQYAFIINCFI